MKKRISQRDIAKILDINVSTVSRALKGLKGVSPSLQRQIIDIAREHGYRPNPFAMSLRYDTTHTIGIVVPDLSFSFYAHIIKTIEAEARKEGYMCIITDSGDTQSGEIACLEHLESLHVEGVVMCLSQETSSYGHLERMKNNHIPLVLFDRAADVGFSSVVINNVQSARQATLHMIDGGARRIAFLGGSNLMQQTADRKHGYLEALRERGLPIRKELVKCSFASFNSGLSDTLELLDLPEPPDAILAVHGILAASAFQAILSRGLRIPDDIAFIGFMSDWVSGLLYPRITFVKQNLKEIGRKAFKLLYDQMNGDNRVCQLVVNARLEFRESTRNKITME